MQGCRRVKLATLAPTIRTAIAAGIRVVRMIVQFAWAYPAAIPVASGVAIDAAVGWGPVEEAHLYKKLIISELWCSLSKSDHFGELKLII